MFAGDLKIHQYRQQSMLEEAHRERLGRTLKQARRQQQESAVKEWRMPMVLLRLRQMAFGF